MTLYRPAQPSVACLFGCALWLVSAVQAHGQTQEDLASEIRQLKSTVAAQQQQIDELRKSLEEQKRLLQHNTRPEPDPPPAAAPYRAPAAGQAETHKDAPLQFRLGSAYFTPVGFLDFTAVFRDTAPGSGIGTNFGNIPYRNAASAPGRLSEFRFSPQNSRIGMRVDAAVRGARLLGYWESDFVAPVGHPPAGNIAVTSNSYPLRLRLFWLDVRKNKFEFLAGQTWSLITPGRQGISPAPADLFYTQDVDVNYQLGLTWGRIPEFRMTYHPSEKVTMAVALASPEQYAGGSGGEGAIALPANLAAAYATQLNNGTTTLSVPNLHPDIIAKAAFDPKLPNGNAFHFEIGGLARTFRTYNPLIAQHFTTVGGGVQANFNIELIKNLRLVTNNYWSDGGGRYIFGEAPDAVVRGDGSLSLVHSGSTVSGFEWVRGSTLLYSYYGGVYIRKNVIIDPANGRPVGYGYAGSADSHNKTAQEFTFGFTQKFWDDVRYGTIALMGQYSYFTRNPWYIATGAPKDTHMNEVFLNLRYTLPGSAPAVR